MKITRSLVRDGTLGPNALNYLSILPEQCVFFRQQQLRHPASLYSLSLQGVATAFENVLKEYDDGTNRYRIRPDTDPFDLKSLLAAQDRLLRCLQDHLADCFLILKTLVDPANTRATTIFAEEYMVQSKLPGVKAFIQSIADYKISLRIANKLKHSQGRLRGVGIYVWDGVNLGYFLEEPNSDGSIGPSSDLHPSRGAFSFARDLKWRFFLVYSLSKNLVTAIERAFIGLHGASLIKRKTSPSDYWDRLSSRMSEIPWAIFPKEANTSAATIRLSQDRQELVMKFPDHIRLARCFPRIINTITSTEADGFSTTFNVPFP